MNCFIPKKMNKLEMYSHCECGPLENSEWLEQRVVKISSSVRQTVL